MWNNIKNMFSGKSSRDVSAVKMKNGSHMQGLPVDQQVPLGLSIAARLLLFLGMIEVVISYLAERVSRFSSGLGLLGLGVFTSGNEAEQPLRLPPRLVGCPRRTMAPDGDESLAPKHPVLNDIDRIASLAPDTKASHCFVVTGVPNRLAGLQRLDCSNRDAL